MLSGLLSDVGQQQRQVDAELQKVVTGETDHVHDLVVSVAKADLALRLVIEVRDQLISSYQEVMRMQM
ncbi:MAG: flagellar hook-basal body complex protein FliE [Planctomycetaceae bacterium]|nr:flagellar hook-basal body complex protein FliE [Planctomycetaceae bacterium]